MSPSPQTISVPAFHSGTDGDRPLVVSVVIPAYNRRLLLEEALASVFAQTYPHWEAIVVDDASTDGTEVFIQGIDDPRVRYCRHRENRGGADARNTGIERATGDYIAFLDSDDIWEPQKLEIQLQAILACEFPERAICYTKLKIVRPNAPAQRAPLRGKRENESVADYLFLSQPLEGKIQTSSLMGARSLILDTQFRAALKKHHDFDLALRLEQNGASFLYIDIPLTVWRHDDRSDRLSKCRDYQFSIDWIATWRPVISRRSQFGFLCKWVYPKLLGFEPKNRFGLAQWILANSCVCGIISPKNYWYQSLRYLARKNVVARFLKQCWRTSAAIGLNWLGESPPPARPLGRDRPSQSPSPHDLD